MSFLINIQDKTLHWFRSSLISLIGILLFSVPPLKFIFKFLIVFNPILNGIVSLLLLFWLFTQYIKIQFICYVQFVSHNINNKSYNARNSPGIKFKSICKILSYQTNDFSSNILFSSVQSFSPVQLFATPRIAACQVSPSIHNSQSLLKSTSKESVMPSNHLILCHPDLLLPSIFPSIRVFSSESGLRIT